MRPPPQGGNIEEQPLEMFTGITQYASSATRGLAPPAAPNRSQWTTEKREPAPHPNGGISRIRALAH
jgi:hypothetical protein